MASGNGCIQHFASKCVKRWDVKLNQVQASLTAKVSKPSVCVALVGMTQGKKSKGASANGTVDTQGLVLKAKVHPADIMDRDGVMLVVDGAANQFPRESEGAWIYIAMTRLMAKRLAAA